MGILDGIVDWLAMQVMNLLDLASTSVLGALGCNMDTFKRYFPAASAMYEIFIWTAIGLVLLNLVWQLYRCYGAGFDIDTENPINLVVRSVIFLLLFHMLRPLFPSHLRQCGQLRSPVRVHHLILLQ